MTNSPQPLVGIVMGSDSDWPKIKAARAALDEFDVPSEVRVMSAHRTPGTVREYASGARERGLRVIIAAAGGAAHLAGVVAAHTILPVIGLPVPTPELGGLDSLLSTVQMPGDVPVATVAVGMGGSRNAGLLAVQILAVSDDGAGGEVRGVQAGVGAEDRRPGMRDCRRSFAKMPTKWETLRWMGGVAGQLVLMDQTRLPTELREVTCRDVRDVWEAIKTLRVRGAPAIGIAAAYGVVLGLQPASAGRRHVLQYARAGESISRRQSPDGRQPALGAAADEPACSAAAAPADTAGHPRRAAG